MPKSYFEADLAKWYNKWYEEDAFGYKPSIDKFDVIIDTPPPFTSGVPHMGHFLWWTWNDTINRYLLISGRKSLLPQGWDCHGLPTELKVEKKYKITKNNPEFVRLCEEFTDDAIMKMRQSMIDMGYSPDWSREYKTHTEEYMNIVRSVLIYLFEKGLLTKSSVPIFWCPKCQTTLAKAEVGYVNVRKKLYRLRFRTTDNMDVVFDTTRPEMFPACVAVAMSPDHPDASKYANKKVKIPIINREVPIILDKRVDVNFGTGIMYVCTYGDETDREIVIDHNLPEISIISPENKMNSNAGPLSGLTIEEARKKAVDLLKEHILKVELIEGPVLKHTERQNCLSNVEIIPLQQWVIKTTHLRDRILDVADKIEWYPEHMKYRFMNWVNSIKWDWVISRQRKFGTKLPFATCPKCSGIYTSDKKLCDKCNVLLVPEPDVVDGWVESSISPLMITEYFKQNKLRLPVYIRQQGHDIIRTWAYYTIVMSLLLTDEKPWRKILINGMVLGPDGKEMHKSLGNVILPDEVLSKYGADASRLGMIITGYYGKDASFSEKNMKYSRSTLMKLWNIARYIEMKREFKYISKIENDNIDILNALSKLKSKYVENMEQFRLSIAAKLLAKFTRKDFANDYLESSKNDFSEKTNDIINFVFKELVVLFHPFAPFITEELYSKYNKGLILKHERL